MFTIVRDALPLSAVVDAPLHVWPLSVTATYEEGDLPAKIFVYHTGLGPLGIVGDAFECVASAMQMTSIPEDDSVIGVPYYRTNTITVNCASADHAEELWKKIQYMVLDLKTNLLAADQLALAETITV